MRKRSNRRRPRRSRGNTIPASRINPQRNRIMRMPPSIALNSNLISLWIRSEWAESTIERAMHVTYNPKNAIDEMGLNDIFHEIRVKRVNFWFISKLPITEPGLNAMAIFDNNQEALKVISYPVVAACPGSDTRRVYQTLCGTWYPTEPSDRNWRPIDDTPFCQIYIATSRERQPSNTILGAIIADAHVSLRGLSVSSTTSLIDKGAGFTRIEDSDSIPSPDLNFEYLTVE